MASHRAFRVAALAWAALLGAACGAPSDPDERDDGVARLTQTVCADGPTVPGIDVSRYQGTIDWAKVKTAGKVFAIVQAGRGTSPDPQFEAHWAGTRANGIIRGNYLRFFPEQDLATQAAILISANATAEAGDLPPMLDVEDRASFTAAQLTTMVKELTARVKAGTGRTPMIYTGYYFWRDFVQSTEFGAHPLVIANYSSSCPPIPEGWSRWTLHQHSSTGSVAGIVGNVDLDRFNGTLDDLKALARADGEVPAATGVLMGALYTQQDTTRRVANVTVSIGGRAVVTGADGLYQFTLPPGTYTVTATGQGWLPSSVERTVVAGATVWGSMNLSPDPDATAETPIVQGRLYRADTLNAVAGGKVWLQTDSGEILTEGQSDAAGAFVLTASRAFSGHVVALAPGFAEQRVALSVVGGQTLTVSFALVPGVGGPSEGPSTDASGGCNASSGLWGWPLGMWLPLVRRRRTRASGAVAFRP